MLRRFWDWAYEHDNSFPIKQLFWVQSLYYKVVPYDYRPGQLFYKLKCFLWHRHTTIKCRYLPHTWCDKDTILLHTSMEILSRFIENECSPGIVNWDGIEQDKAAMKEMREIYEWWHNDYIPNCFFGAHTDKLYNQLPEREITFPQIEGTKLHTMITVYKCEGDKELENKIYDELWKYDEFIDGKKKEMLKRLIDVMDFMWT